MRLHFTIVITICTLVVSAQVTYSPIAIKNLDASICWNVRVQTTGSNERVELYGTISNETGKALVECKSDKLLLNTGMNQLDANKVRTTSVKFLDDEVKQHLERYGTLPAGRYEFCTTVKAARDAEDFGEDCITLTQTATDNLAEKSKLALKGIKFYGNASMEHIYSNRQGTGQVIPPHLFRMYAQPGISFYNVPLRLNFYYTTEQSAARPNQFVVSFEFDEDKFKENLIAMLEKKITEKTNLNVASLREQSAKLSELPEITEKLKNYSDNSSSISGIESQLKSIDYSNLDKELESLSKEVDNSLEKIDYKNQRDKYLQAKNELSGYIPKDSLEEVQKQELSDSLDARLHRLEERKDSVLQKSSSRQKLNSALEKKKKYDELNSQLKTLQATAEQYKQLSQQKAELEQPQNALSNASGSLGSLSSLSDPTTLKQNLIEQGMFTGMNKLFFGVRQLAIGSVYPQYTPYTLSGIQVLGGAIEINPGIFFLNVTGGNMDLGTNNLTEVFKSNYQRWMVGGRIGLGKLHRSFFMINYIHLFDNTNSLPSSIDSIVRPQSNDVASVQLQLSFWKGRIKLYGEVAGSGFNRNRNDELIESDNSWYEKIPNFLKPNLSTSYDYAYTAQVSLNLFRGNVITAYTEYLGPGYYSFGVPYLRNDLLRYGGRVEQAFAKNKLKVNAKYRYEIDNLIETKRATTVMHVFGGGFSYNKRKLPSLKMDYTGHLRNSDFGGQMMHTLASSIGYSYKIAKTNLRTSGNYQFIMSEADSISLSDYTLHNTMVTQSITFRIPLTLLVNFGYNQMKNQIQLNRQVQAGGGIISTPFKNFNAGVNFDYVKNLSKDFRWGTQLDLSYFFLKHLTISVNCRYNHYQNYFVTDVPFDEIVLTTRLTAVW